MHGLRAVSATVLGPSCQRLMVRPSSYAALEGLEVYPSVSSIMGHQPWDCLQADSTFSHSWSDPTLSVGESYISQSAGVSPAALSSELSSAHDSIASIPNELAFESTVDEEPESSDAEDLADSDYADADDDDDDEYTPACDTTRGKSHPRHTNTSRATHTSRSSRPSRYSPYWTPSPSPSPSTSSSSDSDASGRRSAQLRHTSARKKQVAPSPSHLAQLSQRSPRWNCPECSYVQKNRRRPDLKRHIAGHYPKGKHVCCGVPVAEAAQYGITGPALEDAAEWNGEMRVGGCWMVFSRRDALIRHLNNPKKMCVSDELTKIVPKSRK